VKWCKPLFPEDDYNRHYPFDFKDKQVLDFGADYGSTAYYFLEKGAVKVTAVEGDIHLYKQLLENINGDSRVKANYCLIESSKDFERFLDGNEEIVKVDLEGAEIFLLGVNSQLIAKHPIWIIECHNRVFIKKLVKRFRQLNYKLKTVVPVMPKDNPLYNDIKVLFFER
jgi:hypothetical protein